MVINLDASCALSFFGYMDKFSSKLQSHDLKNLNSFQGCLGNSFAHQPPCLWFLHSHIQCNSPYLMSIWMWNQHLTGFHIPLSHVHQRFRNLGLWVNIFECITLWHLYDSDFLIFAFSLFFSYSFENKRKISSLIRSSIVIPFGNLRTFISSSFSVILYII